MKPKTTREVIACLEQEIVMWLNGNRDPHIIACLRRAIAIVRASARKDTLLEELRAFNRFGLTKKARKWRAKKL